MNKTLLTLVCLTLSVHFTRLAKAEIQCPSPPEQASKDSKIAVQLAVGRLGPIKAGETSTEVRRTTQDLLGKLPQSDKVYLEQMMFSAFCSSVRDDKKLTDTEKSRALKDYAREVRKGLAPAQATTTTSTKKSNQKKKAVSQNNSNKKSQPSSLSESDKSQLISSLYSLTHLEAGQSPIHWLLMNHCESQRKGPSEQLRSISSTVLKDVLAIKGSITSKYPDDFIVSKFESFRQLVLDLDRRVVILTELSSGRPFLDSSVSKSSCEMASEYQALHQRLLPIEKDYREYIERRGK